jgi:hypothetical protein
MISHLVLMKPRSDLPVDERRAFIASFEQAVRTIPSVRGVRVGRRVRLGAAYESVSPDTADFFAAIDFDDMAGLQAYLGHPAHEELGTRFYQSLSSGWAYDFEVGGLEMLRAVAQAP